MTRLFLIRHGEPEAQWGVPGGDPGLSPLGAAQAEAAAQKLARLSEPGDGFELLSSPLKRARETAAPTARLLKRAVAIEPRIGEIAAPAHALDRRAWLADLLSEGRSWGDADAALRDWREQLLAAVRGVERDSAMFSHFVAINVVTGAALGKEDIVVCRPDLASISEFEIQDGQIRLLSGAAGAGDAVAT
jgi:broad specificity phosphatase PhoE